MTEIATTSGIRYQIVCMITTSEKQFLRKDLLDACIAKQYFIVDELKERLNGLTNAVSEKQHGDTENDLIDMSLKSDAISTMSDRLADACRELEALKLLMHNEDLQHDRVSPGAVVVTNHSTLFISASVNKVSVHGHYYVGVSTRSQIYRVMAGKTKGQRFSFKGTEYKIKKVF